jgi:hypothetical protein
MATFARAKLTAGVQEKGTIGTAIKNLPALSDLTIIGTEKR